MAAPYRAGAGGQPMDAERDGGRNRVAGATGAAMKQIRGWWLPNDEMHLAELLSRSDLVDGRGTYQYDKLEAAIAHCKRFDLAVDVGANVGLWAWHLAKRFKQVEAFEPMPQHQTCFLWNMDGNFSLNRLALGDREARVGMKADAQGTPSC